MGAAAGGGTFAGGVGSLSIQISSGAVGVLGRTGPVAGGAIDVPPRFSRELAGSRPGLLQDSHPTFTLRPDGLSKAEEWSRSIALTGQL